MNKYSILLLVICICCTAAPAQTQSYTATNKGNLYAYWGWNNSWYSNSTIHFHGNNYDFSLKKIFAKDRQSEFNFNTYVNPTTITIPQYNFRLGYFIKNNLDISFGIDHMKYVMQKQSTTVSGYIENMHPTYDGIYKNDPIKITDSFLQFEHTDGLNYINLELRHTNRLLKINHFVLSLKKGIGGGILLPRTNTQLLGQERYDEFHLAGYGLGVMTGLNISYGKLFFVQSEFKGGCINLPNIRTTSSKSDWARQRFFYSQLNIVFGATFNINKKK